jgi:pseudouridine-5'-monophosphatase
MAIAWPNPIKAVIFDNDGTLMDTEWVYSVAHKEQTGEELDWGFKVKIMGKTGIEAARLTIEHCHLNVSPEEFLAQRREIVGKYWPTVPMLPGAEALIRALKARGIRQAIATASDSETFAVKSSGHKDIIAEMDHVVCGNQVTRGKPEPDLFLAALAKWPGIAPENALVLEDSPLGIAAANRAGMASVFVPDLHVNVEEALAEQNAVPCVVIKSLEDFSFDAFTWSS